MRQVPPPVQVPGIPASGSVLVGDGAQFAAASSDLSFNDSTDSLQINGGTPTDAAHLEVGADASANGVAIEATGGSAVAYYLLCRGPAGEPYMYISGNGSPRSAYTSARFPWFEGFNYHQLDFSTSAESWVKHGTVGSVTKRYGYKDSESAFSIYDSTAASRVKVAVNSSGNTTVTPDGTLDLAATTTITRGGGAGVVSRTLSINTANSSTVSNTTSETNFDVNYSLPAGLTNSVGRALRIVARGREQCTGTVNATLRLKFGTTVLFATAALRMGTASSRWALETTVVCRTSGASGVLFTTAGLQVMATTHGTAVGQSSAALDLTAGHTIQVSCQMDAASASNTMTLEELTIEALNC